MDGSQSFAQSLKHRADEGHMPGWSAPPERGKTPRHQLTDKDLNAEVALDVKGNASKWVVQTFLNVVSEVEKGWLSGPDEYKYVTLEVLLDRDPVVVINRENGLENLEVELFGPTPTGTMIYKLPLDGLIDGRKAMQESRWRELPSDSHPEE
jgi:hypothetical protein